MVRGFGFGNISSKFPPYPRVVLVANEESGGLCSSAYMAELGGFGFGKYQS
jgi:hypothetical protein